MGHEVRKISSNKFTRTRCMMVKSRLHAGYWSEITGGQPQGKYRVPPVALRSASRPDLAVPWGEHRLALTGGQVSRLLCLGKFAKVADVPGECNQANAKRIPTGSEKVLLEQSAGNLSAYGAGSKDMREASAAIQVTDRDRLEVASSIIMTGLPTVDELRHEPGQCPAWAKLIHHSHDAWYRAGMAHCRRRGSVMSAHRSGPRLWEKFRSAKDTQEAAAAIPDGSRARLAKMCKGIHPGPGSVRAWPDGRDSK